LAGAVCRGVELYVCGAINSSGDREISYLFHRNHQKYHLSIDNPVFLISPTYFSHRAASRLHHAL
jgi:hypothetical protein